MKKDFFFNLLNVFFWFMCIRIFLYGLYNISLESLFFRQSLYITLKFILYNLRKLFNILFNCKNGPHMGHLTGTF